MKNATASARKKLARTKQSLTQISARVPIARGITAFRRTWVTVLLTVAALFIRSRAFADPGRTGVRTFDNPIVPGFHPDPSICRVGADFYLVTSSFEYFPGIPVFHSRDLVHWHQLGHVLTDKRQLDLVGVPSSGGIYAPTIRYVDDLFYVITTHVNRGGNFYVTAKDPRGPWSLPVWLDNEGFDPSLLFADGQAYYLRDGKGPDFSHPQVHQTRLDLATGKPIQPFKVIWPGTGGVWPEGAHVYKIKDTYYLLAAEGGTEYGHAEMAGRGPSPFGPFEMYPGNPILSHRDRQGHPIQATGHADLVELPDGTTWAVFLGIRPQGDGHGGRSRLHHLGRETFLAPVTWTRDGWPVIGNAGAVELAMSSPGLPPHPFAQEPARDQFDRSTLRATWNFVRNPDPRDVSLSERPGTLRLWGSPVTLDQIASPALIVRRQQHFNVRIRTQLEFVPLQPNEDAGLTIRANEDFRYDLTVRLGPGRTQRREAVLTSRINGVSTVVGRVWLGDGPVQLSVTAVEDSYRFEVQVGRKTVTIGKLPTRSLAAEEISKPGRNYFTGVFVGLFATGNGQRSTVPADFDWFDYAP
jgi:xylan 1,4-beta-xylosidase